VAVAAVVDLVQGETHRQRETNKEICQLTGIEFIFHVFRISSLLILARVGSGACVRVSNLVLSRSTFQSSVKSHDMYCVVNFGVIRLKDIDVLWIVTLATTVVCQMIIISVISDCVKNIFPSSVLVVSILPLTFLAVSEFPPPTAEIDLISMFSGICANGCSSITVKVEV
jgi:hypothetical protein